MKKTNFIESVKQMLGSDFLTKKELKQIEKTGALVAVRQENGEDVFYIFATDGNKRQCNFISGKYNGNSYHSVPTEFDFANDEQKTNVKPTNRVGVELEFASSTKQIYFYSDFLTLESDSSVRSTGHQYGVEIVSTILDKHDLLNIKHPLYSLSENLRQFEGLRVSPLHLAIREIN